jgi:D-alanine-D-alanine ligase
MTKSANPSVLPMAARRALRIMLIAKHARWTGGLHPRDGSHAVYHQEIRQVLEGLGLNLVVADSYAALFEKPEADFVLPLLNRGGFLNSEMLLPILCERLRLPYLGATPILRGLADDKHLAKQSAAARGIRTAPWAIYRRGTAVDLSQCPPAERHVVKPNASSASWGVSAADSREEVAQAVADLHAEGHDAIVEPFITGHDIEVSVITSGGKPFILPTQIVEQEDPTILRTYQEKRNLGPGQAYLIRPLDDPRVVEAVEAAAHQAMRDYLPFDYGRFEFRLDAQTGEVRFLEVNLNCNLWSKKTIAMAAAQIGWSHADLIETILTESLARQRLLDRALDLAA